MEAFEAVRTLRAVRGFADRPVPEAVLHRILEAGRLSASSMNRQPWQFIVVRERDTLRALGSRIKSGPYLAGTPLAIAVAIGRSSRFAVSDASRAIQSMLLTAWSDGVGSNWVGFGNMPRVKELLGLPEELDTLAVLAFGYPETPASGRKRRKPLREIAHRERYGVPLKGEG